MSRRDQNNIHHKFQRFLKSFITLFCVFLLLLTFTGIHFKKSNISNSLKALNHSHVYQGLTLNEEWISILLNTFIETDEELFVSSIQIYQKDRLVLKRQFVPPDVFVNNIIITKENKLGRYEIKISICLAVTFFVNILIKALIFGLILSFTYIYYRANQEQKRKILRMDIENKISSQVAHDIRSPLTALEMATEDISQLPEENRIMIRGATSRIKDIANNLLATKKNVKKTFQNNIKNTHLTSLLESIVSELRVQHKKHNQIKISLENNNALYDCFVDIDTIEFKRVINNLVNNSIEAILSSKMDNSFFVKITTSKIEKDIQIKIKDNGIGIPKDILHEIGKRGKTFGKNNGNGLGLNHAITTVECWGGALHIESEQNKNTSVVIKIKSSFPPSWFPRKIILNKDIVILDDDQTIHKVWQKRLNDLGVNKTKFSIIHFSEGSDFLNWKKNKLSSDYLLLTDYEFIGEKLTGIDIIKDNNLMENSFLVTSYFEEKRILEQIERVGIKLIPKPIASLIPIEIVSFSGPKLKQYIYIEDDHILRMAWEHSAERAGKSLRTFKSPEEFIAEIRKYKNENTYIYIDSNLGDEQKPGEEFAKELKNTYGFDNLYLATGYRPSDFSSIPWIKDIVDKSPPWES